MLLALALWFLYAQSLHLFLGGDTKTSMVDTDWLNIKTVNRIWPFLIVLGIVRFIQFNLNLGKASLVMSMARAMRPRPKLIMKWVILSCIAFASFALFLSNIMSVKTTIPALVPFYFDDIAIQADRFLFFGHDAWKAYEWLFQFPNIVQYMDFLYAVVWGMLTAGLWYYCFTSKNMDVRRRMQFPLAMILIYFIGGNILATIFSSVGPCYYEVFYDGENFRPLMENLRQSSGDTPLHVLKVQDRLMGFYNDTSAPISGISAVPSMHCGSTLLMLFLFWKSPIARFVTGVFTIIIFVGSVLLAWHYAIDGLMAIPVAILSWKLAGWILDKVSPKEQAKSF